MFKTKSGVIKDKLLPYDLIKLMIPPNYEVHP